MLLIRNANFELGIEIGNNYIYLSLASELSQSIDPRPFFKSIKLYIFLLNKIKQIFSVGLFMSLCRFKSFVRP